MLNELDELKKITKKSIKDNDEGLSEEQSASLNRRIEYVDKSAFSEIKKWVIYTFGIGSCLLLVFVFAAGIYLSDAYLGGLLAGNPNEDLGDFLSQVVTTILFSLAALFLRGVFRKE